MNSPIKSEPVSVVVERRVMPKMQKEFEIYLNEIIEYSKQATGYLGTNVTKPNADNDNFYQVIFRFDSQDNLQIWLDSDERRACLVKINSVVEAPANLQIISGLETWFSLPGKASFTPPPKYKMAVVTWLAITPLLIAFNWLLGPLFKDLSLVPRFLCMTPWIVLIMTYILMPFMAKLFKKWLYPVKTEK